MKSVALHNLGCKVNGYEMDVMQQILQEKGYKIVPFDKPADIYIINTCTVTNIADQKSRQMLHRARKQNPEAIVVAAGCYVQTGRERVEKDEAVDLVIGNNRKKDIALILEEYLQKKENGLLLPEDKTLRDKTVIDINHTTEYERMQLTKTREHTRAYVKIQDGCNQFCSYCIIPYARGRVRSRREEDILEEVAGIVKSGYREIVLTGIHISSYGIDRGAPKLLSLLKKLNEVQGLARIRLGSLEPGIVTEEFAAKISTLSKICPHFHLSLQSGCDETLRRMNRRYTTGEYLEKVEILRKYFTDPAITTDVIVGFPGETEEEFLCTEAFLRKVRFYEMHVFKYSKRQGTRAALMKEQIPDVVKAERSNRLLQLEKQMSDAYRRSFIGKEAEILFEEEKEFDGKVYCIGHTAQYIRAAAGNALRGRIMKGVLTDFPEEGILGVQELKSVEND
ncbi:MAG: tRNA (N(6)-L-threonylcarbamoyladenosine(37)-C(2))-methylthiotransferase MtaB [Roseburia sp.]|nr:tRNA (N(6)-L-threonylcarbamoyladenosine(37)-C(2))-methylthiotransferase MtaB [Ruminococcus sp.]MCM1153744.1 tRNA (N(6)-L-threonylcarbamoyladenosine(37)-C(2))-methylthiotransferase MtaB [Roseburia sp.]MCM1243398.1 tRNA (N(6)-L-threonylcarbamoyladenosine(37)-C(2))-methylthiotransferase MtaB [Roseburia sp.]